MTPAPSTASTVYSCPWQGSSPCFVSCETSKAEDRRTMQGLGTLFLLLTACLASRADHGSTVPDIQVQENFILSRIYGKWYNLAIGSTCPWVKRIKEKMSVSTLVLQEGATKAEISMTSTKWRNGVCEENSGVYQKTDIDGKFLFHTSKWNTTLESYVVHTNYDEYAIFLTKKFNHRHGPAIMAKLYGREPQLRDSLLQKFREVALSVGIPENAIVFMANRGECVPGDREVEPSSSAGTRS